jgi:ATP-dependent RNA helicase RhlE
MSFAQLGLIEPIVRAVTEKGYSEPSPIQGACIPAVLKKRDVMACAQTGTGKTAGFTLPILHDLASQDLTARTPKALILAPTRELAAQIHECIQAYAQYLPIRSAIVFGGVKINPQITTLKQGVDILVATPGRLLDLVGQGAVKLNNVKTLVLDEADRMLDMGFIHDIKKVLNCLPKQRQNLLFSATYSNDIRQFAKGLLNNPAEINVSPQNTTAKSVQHKLHPVDKAQKGSLLCKLIHQHNWYAALVFCKTKHGANKLAKLLVDNDITALAIHGNKSQAARTRALKEFKTGNVQILVATDIAARGLDIEELPQVVNFDLPNVPEDYVHRIGRTGRAGKQGSAISLVSADEIKCLKDIEKILKCTIKREYVPGFEPKHELPQEIKMVRKPKAKPTGNAKYKSKTPRGRGKPRKPGKESERRRGRAG